jgi:NTP pyrophosphatase (non-canonical NTP hydrolase)
MQMMEVKDLCKGLNGSAKFIHDINVSKGFWDKERNVGELLMLVVTELSEALEAHRKDNFAYYNPKGLLTFEEAVKDTFEDEIADSFIRLLDLCNALNIDIEKHIQLKVAYNQTRERLHGKKY